jgi:hypothetical protein
MRPYQILELGRECGPEFNTLGEARIALKEMLDQAMESCRKKCGSAALVKIGLDNYAVKMGSRHSSAYWTVLTIVH